MNDSNWNCRRIEKQIWKQKRRLQTRKRVERERRRRSLPIIRGNDGSQRGKNWRKRGEKVARKVQ
ncbi:hypothetical protein F2Q69_00018402 [Brassica cretica]|uniref:Uncharacterized protein n=1 Tax=Brassica cretica TaxID=69181 RepID=A0A3N6Q816_BRACR|nr:hypothetical protein F2Q69_00018402 [Brassica cretica]